MGRKVQELDNGVAVYQVTDEPGWKDAIYCERCYCSPDSSFFVYRRKLRKAGPRWCDFIAEYIACDFGSWEMRKIGEGHAYSDMSREGDLFFTKDGDGKYRDLMRIDLTTMETAQIPVDGGGVRPLTGMTCSPGETHLGYVFAESYEPQSFGIEIVDLETGKKDVLCYDPFISNPHPQIDPSGAGRIMVQHNRGSKFDKDGKGIITSTSNPGTTHFLVGLDDKKITQLAVGPPHTSTVTGHSQWIGSTGEVMVTIAEAYDDNEKQGTLLRVRPGEKPRVVAVDRQYNHLHVSLCGRFFCVDSTPTNDVFIGSTATGDTRWVCNLGNDYGDANEKYGEAAHSHAYLSRDLNWVVFNSCRSGRPEIHVASIPPKMFEELT